MDIIRFVGFALIAAVLAVVLRQERPELALLVGVAAGWRRLCCSGGT